MISISCPRTLNFSKSASLDNVKTLSPYLMLSRTRAFACVHVARSDVRNHADGRSCAGSLSNGCPTRTPLFPHRLIVSPVHRKAPGTNYQRLLSVIYHHPYPRLFLCSPQCCCFSNPPFLLLPEFPKLFLKLVVPVRVLVLGRGRLLLVLVNFPFQTMNLCLVLPQFIELENKIKWWPSIWSWNLTNPWRSASAFLDRMRS